MPDCTVVSLSAHSAATYAGAAIDDKCFYALQFPDIDGPLVGFSIRPASRMNLVGRSVAEVEKTTKLRVVGINGSPTFEPTRQFHAEDEVVVFGEVRYLETSYVLKRAAVERKVSRWRILRGMTMRQWRRFRHADPIFKVIMVVAMLVFASATIFFAYALKKDPLTSAYFVMTTMTTVGYGDITPLDPGALAKLWSMGIMIAGVVFSGIFTAFLTSALTRAQFNATQGLRKIRAREHIIICGAGSVGTTVIDYLSALGKRLVVIDQAPDALLK